MSKVTAAITGVHAFVPEYRLTNKELEKLVDTTDEWILTRTGISERRILKGKDQGTTRMAVPAVKGLLEKTGTVPEDVDLLIFATVTPDMQFPASANIITDECGLTNAFSFDLNAACSGFIYALTTAAMYIESGRYKKVVVVGGDKMSSIIDYTDRQTCVIFGDAAGAVLMEPNTEGLGVLDHLLHTKGAGAVHLHQKAGGSMRPATHETVDAREHFVYQEGQAVFKFAVTKMAEVSEEVMKRNNLTADDISYLVPHQANKRIIDATASRMDIDAEKVMLNIQRYGNTTNGSIPLCLYEWESRLNKGDNLILSAFGGGFTWGALYIKWAYNPKV
jgi:3-oxoacyl-[acyl-carrier-protein] synthase-3